MVTRNFSSAQAEQALSHLPIPDVLRGRAYAKQDRISGIEWSTPTVLRGVCRGSGRNRYRCTVTLVVQGGQVADTFGSCSCPVATDCKHCAALILAAVDDDDVPAWRALLEEISADAPATTEIERIRPVGLEVATRRDPQGALVLTLRPLVRQPTGVWTPHLPWAVALEGSGDGYEPAGFDGISAIAAIFAPGGTHRVRGTGPRLPAGLELSLAPAAFWKVLGSAVTAGMPLLASGEAATVELTDGFDIVLRLAPHEDGAHLIADLTRDGLPVTDDDVVILGDPATGAAVLAGDVLRLGPLARVTPLETRLLTGDPFDVPTADYTDFLTALPRLTAHRTVELPDRGLAPPEISAPFPLLLIEMEDYGSRTRWRAGYRVDGVLRHFDPAVPERQVGFRDLDGEQQMWRRARPELELFCSGNTRWKQALAALLRAEARHRRPFAQRTPMAAFDLLNVLELRPAAQVAAQVPTTDLLIPLGLDLPDTAILCGEMVNRLTAPGLVQVEITGPQREFREAENTQLHFGTTGAFEWLDLTVTVKADDAEVPLADVIDALARDADWLVLPDGTYFSLQTPELTLLKELLDEARAMGDLDGAKIAADHPNATMWEELLSLGVVDSQLADWHGRVQRLAAARPPEPVQTPPQLQAALRGYQRDGLAWLSFLWDNGLGGILADDMGLGKTVQTLALVTRIAAQNPQVRFLVVAPTSVIGNWAAETARFAPSLQVATVTSTEKRAGVPLAEQIGTANIVITSYTLLRIDYDAFARVDWDGAVFDEAQFLKNRNSKTHQAARRLAAPFKLAITGTPMENNVMELWALVSIVSPGLYRDPRKFREHFAAPIESGAEPERLDILRRRLKPIMLRRTKTQVADDLPPKQESVVHIDLDTKHRKIYDVFLARERQKLLGLLDNWEENRIQILQALTRMRQLSLHPGLVDQEHQSLSSTKIDYLAQHLPQLIAEGHSALVFSSFTGFLQLIADALTGLKIPFSYLDGSMPAAQRQAQIDRFTSGGQNGTKIFLISLKAGGFGLNLTAADYCFVADPWWNPAAEAQAVDRAHRIGQERPVTVYRLVSTGTIEEKVVALQDRKRALFDALIDDGEQFSGKLTADDVRRLVTDTDT
ncbi:putative helicase [Gordonia hirsuta DSM 44140 = NBRC 16056]|uniref:Putative helicase n=1 Tax=Gordonia hirsuta DSM 44140 = NBRC 16056 TaxID=1121927 RepID=L7L7J5_9ACTN|nr:DEAD/DEAH box helicase [Gordonia hirsuta]GAC57125.1 putative helicase [Gordonia hirsuta DSM 44140 = NBRC 16056]